MHSSPAAAVTGTAAEGPPAAPAHDVPVGGARWPAVLSLASGVLNQGALLVTGVLAARALGPEGRGTQALLTLLPFVLSQVGTLGLPSAVVYVAGTPGLSTRSLALSLLRPALVQAVVTSVLQVGALLVVARFHDLVDGRAALVALAVLPVMIAHEYAVALLQGRHRLVAFQVLRTLPNVLYAAVLAWVVAAWAAVDLLAVVTSWLVALTVGAVLSCGAAWRGLARAGRPVDREVGAGMRSFGRRALLGAVSPLEGLRVDQLLAGVVLGPAALGLYVSASAFTGLTRLLSQSVGVVAYPDVARRHRSGSPSAARHRGARYVALVAASTAAVALAVVVAAPWLVPAVFGAPFAGAVPATRILIVAGVLLAVRRVVGDVARGTGRASVNSWAEAGALAALVLAFLVVGRDGSAEAAAWAVLAAAGCGLLVLGLQLLPSRAGRDPA